VENDWFVAETVVMGTSVTVEFWATEPRWTFTPQLYSVTDHRMLIEDTGDSLVSR
jgi:hypothetical protein